MNEVGDYLKKERESKSLSVQEVAERTKISARYLVCIENGDYDKLPPGPYAKGYIAAYARQVCGDETQALALFAASRKTIQSPSNLPAGDAGIGPQPRSVASPARENSGNNGSHGTNGTPLTDQRGGRLAFVRALRQVIPDRSNLKHLSPQAIQPTQDAPDRSVPGDKKKALAASLDKIVAPLTQIFRGNLLKSGLLAGMALFGVSVLVLAGFGVYHLLFFETRSGAMNSSQVSTPQPPVVPPATGKEGEALASASAPEAKAVETTVRGVSPSPPPASASKSASKAAKPENTEPKVIKPKTVKPKALKKDAPAVAPIEPRQTAAVPSPTSKTVQAAVPKTPAQERQASTTAAAFAAAGPVSAPARPSDPSATEIAGPTAHTEGDGSSALMTTSTTASTAPVADIPLKLIKASVCTAIADRMPVGVSEHFPWTTPKIFVWSLLGATDPPAKVRHIYYHDGAKVSDVILKVGSSHWRTWSFHTLSGQLHIGPWRIDIATLDGRVLRRLHFSIE